MEGVRTFLESSTIHGLAYIARPGKISRLIWILVVIGGFTGAGVLIYNSFQAWAESPVKTTIETLPITHIALPKITVCPPMNTLTDLNYDLMVTENMTLHENSRKELTNLAIELLYEKLNDTIMKNLSMLVDTEKYKNWYNGCTKIHLPYYQCDNIGSNYCTGTRVKIETSVSSGSISTEFFGKTFDANKVVGGLTAFDFILNTQHSNNPNATLHLEIEKISLINLPTGEDIFKFQSEEIGMNHFFKNFTPPKFIKTLTVRRRAPMAEIMNQRLKLMPGFRVTWFYSGIAEEENCEVPQINQYDYARKNFVRDSMIQSFKIISFSTFSG